MPIFWENAKNLWEENIEQCINDSMLENRKHWLWDTYKMYPVMSHTDIYTGKGNEKKNEVAFLSIITFWYYTIKFVYKLRNIVYGLR